MGSDPVDFSGSRNAGRPWRRAIRHKPNEIISRGLMLIPIDTGTVMKTRARTPRELKDSDTLIYRPRSSSQAETTVLAALALAGVAAIIMALVSASLPAGVRKDPVSDTAKYVHSGQPIADARTLAAMVRYFLEGGI